MSALRYGFTLLLTASCVGDSPATNGVPPDSGLDSGSPQPDASAGAVASFEVGAAVATVEEHATFTLTVTAKRADGTTMTDYAGAPTFTSTWGDVRTNKVTFVNGVASVTASLNRETNAKDGPALVKVSDGKAVGGSVPITVTLPDLVLGIPAVLKGGANDWDPSVLADSAAMVRKDTGSFYAIYSSYVGTGNSIGFVTALNEKTNFARRNVPALTPSGGNGWDSYSLTSSDLVYDGTSAVLLYIGNNHASNSYGLASSTDGLTFNRLNQIVFTGSNPCDTLAALRARLVVDGPGQYRVFYQNQDSSAWCVAASKDAGQTWPANQRQVVKGFDLASEISQIVKDGSVYKAYQTYSGLNYFTSSDGITWVRSPRGALPGVWPQALVIDPSTYRLIGLGISQTPGYAFDWVSRP